MNWFIESFFESSFLGLSSIYDNGEQSDDKFLEIVYIVSSLL